MRSFTRIALASLAVATAASVGYGVAANASPSGPTAPTVPSGALQKALPYAGVGNSPRPPTTAESTYVPLKNCRLVNTSAAGGRIPAGSSRAFYVVGTANFPTQGGTSGGCGIPAAATAISARVSAVSATLTGAFVAYPTGTPTGQGTLYYAKGVNTTTGATLQIGPGTGQVLTVANVAGNAQLVIDVNGYYIEQMEGMISSSGTSQYSGSNRIVSSTHDATGQYTVNFDQNVGYCTPMVNTYSGYVYGSAYAFNGSAVKVYTWYLDNTTHLPVPFDAYFYITVTC